MALSASKAFCCLVFSLSFMSRYILIFSVISPPVRYLKVYVLLSEHIERGIGYIFVTNFQLNLCNRDDILYLRHLMFVETCFLVQSIYTQALFINVSCIIEKTVFSRVIEYISLNIKSCLLIMFKFLAPLILFNDCFSNY